MKHGLGVHVDCCLGGFLLPWLRRSGHITKKFDFLVPGVTSVSADIHKYEKREGGRRERGCGKGGGRDGGRVGKGGRGTWEGWRRERDMGRREKDVGSRGRGEG